MIQRVLKVRRAICLSAASSCVFALVCVSAAALQQAQAPNPAIQRESQTVTVEPYARNIVRVTISTIAAEATAAPGPGLVAQPDGEGWSHATTPDGADVFTSGRMAVTVAPGYRRNPHAHLPDTAKFFSGSTSGVNIRFALPDGTQLTDMEGWKMAALNQKDDTLKDARGILPADLPLYTVGATFDSPDDEHYYGLGQNQEGYLDHRARPVTCAANYLAPGSPSWCVPFLVTNKGYGILWDNPSPTTIYAGFDDRTSWSSALGKRVSYFVIAGKTPDEIYAGYRLLTGATPMLPKAAYGFIQCKQRYRSQAEVLAVAKGYRERHLPLDMIVVDWFYYTQMGQYDFDPTLWPDPAAMNRELHAENIETMISVWPRFAPGSRYYDRIRANGWFEHYASGIPVTPDEPAPGEPVDGLPYDMAGSDIDTTNPAAANWWWSLVRDNIQSRGFDYFWADETEPDLPPDGAYLHVGPGEEFFNVYPLFHTAALYDGVRRDDRLGADGQLQVDQKPSTDALLAGAQPGVPHVSPSRRGSDDDSSDEVPAAYGADPAHTPRALILSRDAFTGLQRNSAIVWTSDISPTWDTLRRQVPTLLNDAASGIPYVGDDIGGWQGLPYWHVPAHPPLISPEGARANVHQDDDYPELYVRWFEFGTFTPTMRTHGTRTYNEVWSYGPEAEPILEKYLKLRYALIPYIYSLGWRVHQTGAPLMRALWMDFGRDPKVLSGEAATTEYMFGPSLLVAPVLHQGQTTREVYLPAGTDWYNYWTGEKLNGGQTVTVQAPIDTIPLFVKAGSILPIGAPVESTHDQQAIAKIKVYPGADAAFTLYSDDGTTYAYEQGVHAITELRWDDAAGKLTQSGAEAWRGSDKSIVEVVGGRVQLPIVK